MTEDGNETYHCPLDCFHSGQCKSHSMVDQFYCDCPLNDSGGFQGLHCEIPFSTCTDDGKRHWRCLNYGTCNIRMARCDCPLEFRGDFCEIYNGPCNPDHGELLVGTDCSLSSTNIQRLSNKVLIGATSALVLVAILFFVIGWTAGRIKPVLQHEKSTTEREPPESPEIKVNEIT
uniref:EGF-like domain-containing protein n=1 Tax=Corethron hystrix TaxID=216773 RepID=A0A7S1FT13_9STRA